MKIKVERRIWAVVLIVLMMLCVCGCSKKEDAPAAEQSDQEAPAVVCTGDNEEAVPCPSPVGVKSRELSRFASNSPFDVEYTSPIGPKPKRLWAKSCLWEKAPEIVVEKWMTDEPDTKGKYVLIEFWGTWCSQCEKAVPHLNEFYRKYSDKLAIVAISDESEKTVRDFEQRIDYSVAIDTQARMKNELTVSGLPHIIILEPDGYVVWEGFPFLPGYELTSEVIEKILAVGAKMEAEI
jgi:thiol-disulfide isomerase/thioredoxin